MKIERRSFFKYILGWFGATSLLSVEGIIVHYWKRGRVDITEKDIVPGNIFMRDDDGFPEVILRCSGQVGVSGKMAEKYHDMTKEEDILYMLGGIHGDPLMPYGDGGVITGNDFMLKERGINCDVIRQRYKNGLTGYTRKEMTKALNYDKFRLVGKIKYKWPSSLKKRLHGTMYFEKNPKVSSNVIT